MVESPPGGRAPRHVRQAPVCPRWWRVRPHRELDATHDKHLFVLDSGRATMTERAVRWPVYKGASFDLWEPDTDVYYASVDSVKITDHLQKKRQSQHQRARSPFSEFVKDWIDDPDTLPCLQPRIAFRDVTNSTNTRTVIASLIPGGLVTTHKAPYLLLIKGIARDEAFLLGVLSSMILDWYARRVVELGLTFHLLNNFPIPDADLDNDPVAHRVVEIAGRLGAVDDRFTEWAEAVGVPVGSVTDEDTKQDLICELDACVAHLYDLDEDDLAVIYETFHERTDYSERHAAVLEHFRRIT